MKKIVKIGGREISVRGIKFKEMQEFSGLIEGKAEHVLNIVIGENVIQNIYSFAIEQMNEIPTILERFTDLKKSDIEDMELTELKQLAEELLLVNGIDKEQMESFFIRATGFVREIMKNGEIEEEAVFTEKIPNNG